MSKVRWQKAILSPCEKYHLVDGEPLYLNQFTQVMKYHEPGLAPAKDWSGAFHIDSEGRAAYINRFTHTFGFYEGLAAVERQGEWFHITPTGEAAYPERYQWCGNFQQGYCAIKDKTGSYFHINGAGGKPYPEHYCYVGDFKDGIAVACNENGLHTHIKPSGELLHEQWFIDLDIFHKGFARVKDEKGWFHVNRVGIEAYPQRYLSVEPFYNGAARVETFDGGLRVINSSGEKLAELRAPLQKPWQQLSGDMVGFWRTEIIAAAVQLNIFQYLPGTLFTIAAQSNLPIRHLERLLRALWEIGLVDFQNREWELTDKGELLVAQNENFLASAAIMWSDVNSEGWKCLPDYIRTGVNQYHPLFKAMASDEKLKIYHKAIDGYARQDFTAFISAVDWQRHQKIMGVGRSAKVILESLLENHAHLEAVLLGEEYILKYCNLNAKLQPRYSLKPHNILDPWPQAVDAIILPRLLHYWPNEEALRILKCARKALLPKGKIYVLEMLLCEENPNGSLLDINMLIESGGGLRFLSDWITIFQASQLQIKAHSIINPYLHLLILEP